MKDDDNEYHTMRSHSPLSLAFAFVIFIGIIYGANLLVDLYRTGRLNLAYFTTQFRVCDSNAGKPNPPPPPIKPFNWQNTGLITLWFDDGWETQYSVAFAMMQKESMVGADAIATGFVCRGDFVTWNNLRTMQNAGWEMTAHTINHSCDLSYYNAETIPYELSGSKQIIEKHGLRADQFVMPCGYSQEEIEALVGDKAAPPIIAESKKYFSSYRTTKSQRLNVLPVLDPYNLNALQLRNTTPLKEVQIAIDAAVRQKAWLILVFHQIDDTNRVFSITRTEFQQILDMVKASGLPVVLPSQALSIKSSSSQPNNKPALPSINNGLL